MPWHFLYSSFTVQTILFLIVESRAILIFRNRRDEYGIGGHTTLSCNSRKGATGCGFPFLMEMMELQSESSSQESCTKPCPLTLCRTSVIIWSLSSSEDITVSVLLSVLGTYSSSLPGLDSSEKFPDFIWNWTNTWCNLSCQECSAIYDWSVQLSFKQLWFIWHHFEINTGACNTLKLCAEIRQSFCNVVT